MDSLYLKAATLRPDVYPCRDRHPFNLPIFGTAQTIAFTAPVTFFAGENGTGKSTLLEALAHACSIYIWRDTDRTRFHYNPYEKLFHHCMTLDCAPDVVGAFFCSDSFRHFAQLLDEWATNDPAQLEYFGGRSLMEQSHGQSIMSFFKSRCRRAGLYLLDEPETALSPRTQLDMLRVLDEAGRSGHAQFIIATHSPLLLACPGAVIYSFDGSRIRETTYEETSHYKVYRDFLNNRNGYLRRK
ncbi:MAG TPA: AAA family ATPase [Nitrospirota bacterium]|nr:AAA family ATPase [Nitrospirota bacterium]